MLKAERSGAASRRMIDDKDFQHLYRLLWGIRGDGRARAENSSQDA
jgi:hypothetical protein